MAYVRNFLMPQPLSHHFTHFWSFHPWSINETLPWRAWLGLRIPTVDSLPPTQIKHQTPRLLHYVIRAFLTLLPGPLRHLWQLTVQTTDIGTTAHSDTYSGFAPPDVPFPTEPSPTYHYLHRAHFSSRVVHQIQFKIITHSNNTRELFIEEIPMSGLSKCRDPEHYFYGLFGQTGEWSLRTADYWRHHFEIPLVHGQSSLFTMSPLRLWHLRRQPAFTPKIQEPGPTTFNHFEGCYGIWGKSATRGGCLKTWASVTRSKHFKLRRTSLLSGLNAAL